MLLMDCCKQKEDAQGALIANNMNFESARGE